MFNLYVTAKTDYMESVLSDLLAPMEFGILSDDDNEDGTRIAIAEVYTEKDSYVAQYIEDRSSEIPAVVSYQII